MMDVSTAEAARLYGCRPDSLRRAFRAAGLKPVRYEKTQRPFYGGYITVTTAYYDPATVLKVRAWRAENAIERIRKFTKFVRHPHTAPRRSRRANLLKAAGRQDFERLRILQRVAKREGTTVAKLVIDKGLQDWYRSLPPKHREEI